MFVDRHLDQSCGKANTLTMPYWHNLTVLLLTCCTKGFGPLRDWRRLLTRVLQGLQACIKMLMELPSRHIFMGQDLSPVPSFSASACVQHTQPPAYAFSPDLHVRLPGRAHSLSDLRCHKVSYMLPRVTKLPDAGDKGVRPGREAGRIKSLAVCLTSNQPGGR